MPPTMPVITPTNVHESGGMPLSHARTVADAEKVGIYAVALDGEFVKFSYEIFPRECLCALKQLLKRMRLKGAYDYHYTFGKS